MSETRTLTLADFILQRIAEDEAAAHAAASKWHNIRFPHIDPDPDPVEWCDFQLRFTPARVLAECEAKRRIVESLRDCPAIAEFDGTRECLESVCRDLAAVFADHPDYREEWKP